MVMEGAVCNQIKIKFSAKRVEAGEGKVCLTVHPQSMASLPGNKRAPLGVLEGQREKRQKIDTIMKEQCGKILSQLMKPPYGYIFNEPVDPVKLNIPDYFSIISQPMDLGTIKSNLVKNKYLCIEDFAADVRLTFANAMLYNRSSHLVHQVASDLSRTFENKWKILNANCDHGPSKVRVKQISARQMKEIQDPSHKAPSLFKKSDEKVWRTSESNELEFAKTANYARKMPSRNAGKGTASCGRPSGGSVRAKPPTCKCGSTKCRCSIQSNSAHTSSSGITSEKSMVVDNRACMKQESRMNSASVSQMSKSDPDSDGAVSALEEESLCHSSRLTGPADCSSGEGWSTPLFDARLSPKRALRTAKLKSRFADTILKAQQKTLLVHSAKVDFATLQQGKEELKRKQRQEKARIEAKIIAATAAKCTRAEAKLKMQREREREAARMEVEKVVKTVELEENVKIVKELEVLGCYLGAAIRSPLEQLGLFIKQDYAEEDVDDFNDNQAIEEGEICY